MTTTSPLQRLLESERQGMKPGLERMVALDALLENPSRAFASVHVGGTNGKGSVTTKVASSLSRAGLKVGLYTSPHITRLTERIQIDGCPIDEESLTALLEEVFSLADLHGHRPTFFETMTLAAFLHFAKSSVDFAAIEVGMGGRLDATNIIEPKLSIITSLDYDHTRYLGATLEAIAHEKAGIIKSGSKALLGPKVAIKKLFENRAREVGAAFRALEGTFDDYEMENRFTAREALLWLKLPFDSKGLEVTPRCRFELVEREIPIILDVGHNPEAFRALFGRLEGRFGHRRSVVLLAMSEDKEIEMSIDFLSRQGSIFFFTQAPSERAAPPELFSRYLAGRAPAIVERDLKKAFGMAYSRASLERLPLVVCGTFFMMGEVCEILGEGPGQIGG